MKVLVAMSMVALMFGPLAVSAVAEPPGVGASAPEFELPAVSGELDGKVALKDVVGKGPVVLVVLRGFPGYQCPVCSRQVGSFVNKAKQFQQAGAKVLFIYPGPAKELEKLAGEFLKGNNLPEPFTLLIDPDYKFTNSYGLRWEAPRETAYPSTFVVGVDGKIQFSKISQTHGDRAAVERVLQELAAPAK